MVLMVRLKGQQGVAIVPDHYPQNVVASAAKTAQIKNLIPSTTKLPLPHAYVERSILQMSWRLVTEKTVPMIGDAIETLPVVVAVKCPWKDVHHQTITPLSPRNVAAAAFVVVPYRTNHDPDLDARHPPNEAPIGTMTRPLIDEAVGDMIIPLDDATKVVSLLWNGTAEIETLRSTVGRGPCPWSADETTFQGKNDLLEESNHLLSPTASHTKRIHLRAQIQPWHLNKLLPLTGLREGERVKLHHF